MYQPAGVIVGAVITNLPPGSAITTRRSRGGATLRQAPWSPPEIGTKVPQSSARRSACKRSLTWCASCGNVHAVVVRALCCLLLCPMPLGQLVRSVEELLLMALTPSPPSSVIGGGPCPLVRKPCLVGSFLVCDVVLDDVQWCTAAGSGEVRRGPEPATHPRPVDPADEVLPQSPRRVTLEGVDEVGEPCH